MSAPMNCLLSCSPSRVLSKHRHSGSAQALCFWTTSTAGGRALMFAVKGFEQASAFWFSPGAVLLDDVHGRGQG
jgi:hypothetical protein